MPDPVSTAVVLFVTEATVKVWFMAVLAALPVWPVTTISLPTYSVAAAWVMVVEVAEAATLCDMERLSPPTTAVHVLLPPAAKLVSVRWNTMLFPSRATTRAFCALMVHVAPITRSHPAPVGVFRTAVTRMYSLVAAAPALVVALVICTVVLRASSASRAVRLAGSRRCEKTPLVELAVS